MKITKPLIFVFILIGLGFGGSFLYWLNYGKPNGEVANHKNQSGIELCAEFKNVDYKISCEEAVARVLSFIPGNLQNISIASTAQGDLWLIDLEPVPPYYMKALQKEIKLLRLGISINEYTGIYRWPLDL